MKNLNCLILKAAALAVLLTGIAACVGFSGKYYGLDKEDYDYIKKESSGGGALDFSSKLDSTRTYTFNEKQYNYRQMALVMWGNSVRDLGVKNRHDAVSLFEEIAGTKLAIDDRKALIAGFENK